MRELDPLADVRANSFIGTRSLERNLEFVPASLRVGQLFEGDRATLLASLDEALPSTHLDALWNIVGQRWLYWRSLCEERA